MEHLTRVDQLQELIQLCISQLDLLHIDGAYKLTKTIWHVPVNERTDFEVIYVLKGSARFEINGQQYVSESGEVYLIDNQHGNICLSCEGQIIFCTFSVGSIKERLYSQVKQKFNLLQGKFFIGDSKLFADLFTLMTDEFILPLQFNKDNVKLILIQLWIELYRQLTQHKLNKISYINPRQQKIVNEIQVYLRHHLNQQISVEEIASFYGMSPEYINRIFKKATGLPILRYHNRIRIEHSKKLLAEKNFRIIDIAEELGFWSPQHFNKIFKQMMNITPSEYRKNNQKF